MSKGKENNCRLCLETLNDDYNVIEDITREIFEVLLLKVNLSISEEPLVCKTCMGSIREAFNFKSICISVEKQVISLAIDRNCTELDIRDVYLSEKEDKCLVFSEGYNVCRFCLLCLERSNFNLLSDLRKNSTDVMLLKCIPELCLNVIKEPMVCATCIKSLESYYTFATKCQNTEENIMKYTEIQGAECYGQINLRNVVKVLFKDNLEYNGNFDVALKEENNLFENEEDTHLDINSVVPKIEEEELIIKDENQYPDFEIENNRCCETKWKEVLRYDMPSPKDSSDIVYRCERCTFESKYETALKNHMLSHENDSVVTTYRCTLCSYNTKLKGSLKRQVVTYKVFSDIVMCRCKRCMYETKNKTALKKHMPIHKNNSDGTTYKCKICSYKAKCKIYLICHIVLTHNDASHIANLEIVSEMTMYKCNLCIYETERKDYLKKHMVTHKESSDVAMYRCEKCIFETKCKKGLQLHMRNHQEKLEVSEVTTHRWSNIRTYGSKKKSY